MEAEFFRVLKPTKREKPSHLSFSAIQEIESCPVKWIFSHSYYTDIAGAYPRKPVGAAINGQIVHRALEHFGTALDEASNPLPNSEQYFSVREAFSVRTVIRKEREHLFAGLVRNPRANLSLLEKEVEVDPCINAFKRLCGRYTFSHATVSGYSDVRQQPFVGAHIHRPSGVAVPPLLCEHWIELADPPICGRIDLVVTSNRGDSIVDYKTGKQQPDHAEQLDFYALLWAKSHRRNIIARSVIYSNGDRLDLGVLSAEELQNIARKCSRRSSSAMAAITNAPPALPDGDKCKRCDVRQLCPQYWQSSSTENLRWRIAEVRASGPPEWKDLELQLDECTVTSSVLSVMFAEDGEKSTKLECVIPEKFMQARRATDTSLRLLTVLLRRHDGAIQVIWTDNSEAYWYQAG